MIVDAHHHFWNTARNPLPWMMPDHGANVPLFLGETALDLYELDEKIRRAAGAG
jgi:predicted TIM-barrel fold metal-dependent hydrolase